jgi:hypothetical protein
VLVAFGIAGDATSRILSRLFGTGKRVQPNVWQFIGIVASIGFLVMAASEYSTLVSLKGASFDADFVVAQSKFLFAAALLTGGGLVLVD